MHACPCVCYVEQRLINVEFRSSVLIPLWILKVERMKTVRIHVLNATHMYNCMYARLMIMQTY